MSCPYLDRDGFSYKSKNEILKLNLYADAGVREYWIVDPENRSVQVFLLDSGLLRIHEEYGPKDIAKVNVLNGCFIELSRVFSEQTGGQL